MSRWSTPEETRGQTEPVVALVALFAVCVGVSLYAGVLSDVTTSLGSERDVAGPTLDRVEHAISTTGILDPVREERALDAGPDGYGLHVSVRADGQRWTAGPTPPEDEATQTASRRVGVRVGSGQIRPGRLQVVVWR
ncbi:hypothetical protein SAMN04487949_0873 [Halogranum gelatinilyticum]|uniref:Uncharacterized protein n=1 Tax=Halogranum gelatinilyticum TaxID=660521 RepID=A0A1G9QHZ4_9EURY|nr:hypothetical protein [Halogranum gelatinilyticum]SDM10698.1 hypothetical protein SAMN04487949_0873 [Halogranum gelatinilyticum]